ncbi:MAG: SAM-dependent methyltransferase [Taibaiella sp.]|nr:SAM-dependent methyltransferase [Taibaiella sp.]
MYLIPLPVAEGALQTLSPEITEHTGRLTHYFVEDARTARRFIKQLHPAMNVEPLQFSETGKHDSIDGKLFAQWIKEGHSIGIMSEAGCPGIADPGAELVALAHTMQVDVVPLTGPSSIILALMASGLNGQSFAFTGYLPVKDPLRGKRIKELEALSAKERQTQAFIETPYRNNQLLTEVLKQCNATTRLCIAQNITAPNAFVKTKSVADWKKEIPVMEKAPAVFLILSQ